MRTGSRHGSRALAAVLVLLIITAAASAQTLTTPKQHFGFDIGDDYFVMELLSGTTLQTMLRTRGRLEREELRNLPAPVADARKATAEAGAGATVTSSSAVSVAPSLSVTVRVTVYVSPDA